MLVLLLRNLKMKTKSFTALGIVTVLAINLSMLHRLEWGI